MKPALCPEPTELPHFIGAWTIDPIDICDDLIAYFESNKSRQKQGQSAGGLDLDLKDSIDISISPNELHYPQNKIFKDYFHELLSCYRDYAVQWPFLKSFAEEVDIGRFNIQRYRSGQHYQRLHTERSSLSSLHRLFAWMTYLNDVDSANGGATVFDHYGIRFQPQKGLTLIWPAEWTHAHFGSKLNAGSKYIITGWMQFPLPES